MIQGFPDRTWCDITDNPAILIMTGTKDPIIKMTQGFLTVKSNNPPPPPPPPPKKKKKKKKAIYCFCSLFRTEFRHDSLSYLDRYLLATVNRYHLAGKEKVVEQHILVKCSKCSHFGVVSILLKVAASTFTHSAMVL